MLPYEKICEGAFSLFAKIVQL